MESIRAANGDPTVARKRATAKSISQLRRARDSTRQQLMEAEQLVPKLKALVENLQKEVLPLALRHSWGWIYVLKDIHIWYAEKFTSCTA